MREILGRQKNDAGIFEVMRKVGKWDVGDAACSGWTENKNRVIILPVFAYAGFQPA